MGKVTRKEMPMWAKTGHAKPVSRRDFLAAGLIPFAASALVPGLSLFANPQAHAANCAAAGTGLIPFINVNLNGGAALAGNYLPRNAAGELLPSYTIMGQGNNTGATALTLESEFGVNSWPSFNGNVTSQFLNGIREQCDPSTLASTAFVAVCVQSQDDSSMNKFDLSGLVFKAGLVGSHIPNLGTRATATGSGNAAALITPPSPLNVRSFDDVANTIGYTRALAMNSNALTGPQQNRLARLVSSLTNSQARKLASIQSASHVTELLECAGIKNASLIGSGSSAVSPVANAAIVSRWGVQTASYTNQKTSRGVIFSTMVYNALLGQAGSVTLDLGGYDYHTGNRTTGDTRDREAGNVVGRVLDTARIMNRKVFIYVTSDGAAGADGNATPGAGAWVSDRGDQGLAMMLMYDPAGRPATSGFQIGSYTNGQVANNKHAVGNSPEAAAQAAFANYLKFNKRMDLFERVIPRNALETSVLSDVVKVA